MACGWSPTGLGWPSSSACSGPPGPGVASGRAGPRPQPVRTHRRPARDQPGGLGLGRRAVLDLAAAVCQQPGPWRDQLRTRTTQQHKPAKIALAATANAIGRTLFALMASGAEVDPGFEANRATARKAGGQAA
jgi:hypothetical protein